MPINTPVFLPVGAPACDSAGDMFFNISYRPGDLGPFLKIEQDGSKHTVFDLPFDERDWGSVNMAVSPDGIFYVLHSSLKKHSFKLLRYRGDGGIAEKTDFDIPRGTRILQFAVASSGIAYVGGYTENDDPSNEGRDRPAYAALFTSSGKLLRELGQRADRVGMDAEHPAEGGVSAAPDGRFYVLANLKVLVINQTGEIERTLEFQKPTKESYPARIDYSEGAISIEFDTVRTVPQRASILDSRMLLLDAGSGERLGDYLFDPKFTGNAICFRRSEGYSMWARGKEPKIQIIPIH